LAFQLSLPTVMAVACPVISSSSEYSTSIPTRCERVAASTPAAISTAAAPTQNGRCGLICSPSTPASHGARAAPENRTKL
jgi:hypothetical protein